MKIIQDCKPVHKFLRQAFEANSKGAKPSYCQKVINLSKSCDTFELSSSKIKKKKTTLFRAFLDKFFKTKSPKVNQQELNEQLEQLACALSKEYEANADGSRKIMSDFLFGVDGSSKGLYQDLKTRTKEQDSILCKLKSKYQAGRFTLAQNFEENLSTARSLINDAYGSRLLLKEISQEDYKKVLSQFDIEQDDFCKKITALMQNPNLEIDDKYLEAIEALKELQTKDVFNTLLNGIKNKTIDIGKFENYGDTLSSYFSKRQIAQLVDAYSEENNGKILAIVTKDASGVTQELKDSHKLENVEFLDDNQLLNPERYHITSENKKVENIQDAITPVGAVKQSGYATTQMDVKHKLSKDSTEQIGLGEFQIRGVKVNSFGDVEHIPYDIVKGKISADDPKYKDIYTVLKNMTTEQFSEYNEYLSKVYTYLRLQELGINIGKMPVLDARIAPQSISYQGLLKYAHE